MRKNKMMRAASGLMVLTMLSTCAISGTFAKYVTEDRANDTARVAKWGVALQVDGNLYGTDYLGGNSTTFEKHVPTLLTDVQSISVSANATAKENGAVEANLVAPGTQSDKGFHFAINGTPEVDNKINAAIKAQNIFLAPGTYGVMISTPSVSSESFVEGVYYKKNGSQYEPLLLEDVGTVTEIYTLEDLVEFTGTQNYYPVEYTLSNENDGQVTYNLNGEGEYTDTINEIAVQIANALGTTNGETKYTVQQNPTKGNKNTTVYEIEAYYEQNVDLATIIGLNDTVLSWSWDFTDAQEISAGSENLLMPNDNQFDNAHLEDKLDTILGNLMAERSVATVLNGGWAGDPLEGQVVKLSDAENNTYGLPTVGEDFCLDTSFSLEIIISQVD